MNSSRTRVGTSQPAPSEAAADGAATSVHFISVVALGGAARLRGLELQWPRTAPCEGMLMQPPESRLNTCTTRSPAIGAGARRNCADQLDVSTPSAAKSQSGRRAGNCEAEACRDGWGGHTLAKPPPDAGKSGDVAAIESPSPSRSWAQRLAAAVVAAAVVSPQQRCRCRQERRWRSRALWRARGARAGATALHRGSGAAARAVARRPTCVPVVCSL